MAQTLQNQLAETYIFDLMGNLAYENNELDKAEKLFVDVMKRLMQLEKATEDDIRLLHISTKVAHIAYLKNDLEKAMIGFEYVMEKVEKKEYLKDDSVHELWGLVKNFLGQGKLLYFLRRSVSRYISFLAYIGLKQYDKAKEALLSAREVFVKFKEESSEDGIILLNNLAVVHAELKEFELAEKCLERALEIGKELKVDDLSPYQINLGMLYFKQRLIDKAQAACKAAWLVAQKFDNQEAIKGADYCLEQVKAALS